MKVSDILKPALAAQLEGKVNLSFKEHQKEHLNKIKEENKINDEQVTQHKIDLLV